MGRQREVAELQGGLDEAVSGRGRLFLLSGEPGIGKSRLADELADEATGRGTSVLWGRCWEAGGAPPFWPWIQAIRSHANTVDERTLRRQLGPAATELAQIVPDLAQLVPGLASSPLDDPEAARFRLFDSVATLLRRASQDRPMVLILDDLQAADAPSLLLLRFLAGELPTCRLMVVGTYRDLEVGPAHPLTSTLADLVRYPATRRLHLRGLEPLDVARYVQDLTGLRPSDDVVDAVHRETEGNPFFLGEVVRLAAAEGRLEEADPAYWERAIPQGVREVIGLRVNRLSKECARTLSLASVLGREFDVDPLCRISGLTPDEMAELVDEATRARVIGDVAGSPGRLRFGHALIRDTLYDELPPSHRARVHARAAEALEEVHRADPAGHLAELAHHFFEAGSAVAARSAVHYARLAAARALDQLAYEESVRLYRIALRALERGEVADEMTRLTLLLALGDAQMRAGDTPGGRASFLAAAEGARRAGEPGLLAGAALGYGGRFVWARAAGDRHIVALLRDALELHAAEPSAVRARLMARLAGALRDEPVPDQRAALSLRAVEMARGLGDPATLAYALDGRYAAIWAPDTAEERLAIADEMIRLTEQIGDEERAFQGHHYRLSVLLELGDVPAVRVELERNARAADELNQPAQRWYVSTMISLLGLLEGRLADADARIEEAYDHGRRAESVHALAILRLQRYALRREVGGVAEVEGELAELMEDYWFWPCVRAVATHLAMELGRTDEARRQFESCARSEFRDWPLDNDWLLSLTLFADVCTVLGDERRAAALYEQLAPYEQRNAFGHPEFGTGSVARSLGNLAATMRRFDDAERHFAVALEMNARMGAAPWVARTRHELARMLLARDEPGDREQAVHELTQAAAVAADLGQVRLQEEIAAALGTRAGAAVAEEPNVFAREGEYWLVRYAGREARLRDSKGMAYLATLLARPGREIHALDLVAACGGTGSPSRAGAAEPGASSRTGDLGPVLDERAKRDYRSRIADLRAEIDEAEAWNDGERSARAQDELDFLLRELTGAVGLGGRDRRKGSDAERARVNVTRAVRAAMERLAEQHPELGGHLQRSVRTGTFCAYEPGGDPPVEWALARTR